MITIVKKFTIKEKVDLRISTIKNRYEMMALEAMTIWCHIRVGKLIWECPKFQINQIQRKLLMDIDSQSIGLLLVVHELSFYLLFLQRMWKKDINKNKDLKFKWFTRGENTKLK